MNSYNEHCAVCGGLYDLDSLTSHICESCRTKLSVAREEANPLLQTIAVDMASSDPKQQDGAHQVTVFVPPISTHNPIIDKSQFTQPTPYGISSKLEKAIAFNKDLHKLTAASAVMEIVPIKTSNWTDGKPFVVTEEQLTQPWNGYRDGRTFRCFMCGGYFQTGNGVRFVWVNGVPEAREAGVHTGNIFIHVICDSTDLFQRIAAVEAEGKKRFWWMVDYEHLPANPSLPKRKR